MTHNLNQACTPAKSGIETLSPTDIEHVAGGPVFLVPALVFKAGNKMVAAAIVADSAVVAGAGYALGRT